MPLSHFSEDQRVEIERQLGIGVVDRDVKPHNVTGRARSAYTGSGQKRGMSRNEQRFEAYLHDLKLAGRVTSWSYEVLRVKLPAHHATALLDFVVRASGAWGYSGLVVVEVKPRGKDGKPYFGPKGRLRVKLVAQSLAQLEVPVLVAYPCGGGWNVEQIASGS